MEFIKLMKCHETCCSLSDKCCMQPTWKKEGEIKRLPTTRKRPGPRDVMRSFSAVSAMMLRFPYKRLERYN